MGFVDSQLSSAWLEALTKHRSAPILRCFSLGWIFADHSQHFCANPIHTIRPFPSPQKCIYRSGSLANRGPSGGHGRQPTSGTLGGRPLRASVPASDSSPGFAHLLIELFTGSMDDDGDFIDMMCTPHEVIQIGVGARVSSRSLRSVSSTSTIQDKGGLLILKNAPAT